MPAWHPAACRPARRRRGLRRRRRCSPAAAAARAAPPAVAPDPAWWAPNARLLDADAPRPRGPPRARFATGLTGWTLLGPGAVTVRAGGPGGHYAALRDNTTLETPPLADRAQRQQVVLISARAPVGSPLVHVTAVARRRRRRTSLGDLRPTASWDTFAFNAAGLGGQTRAARARSGDGARRTPSISRAWGRASRSRPA